MSTIACDVTAIIAAHNEEDIIGQVIGDLIENGLSVYLLDHRSTDDTAAEASKYLGRGLLRIERFPDESGYPLEVADRFSLAAIIGRKQQLARELTAQWFINADADEFREGPWPNLNLRDSIRAVDEAGYNAIDFAVLDFWPTHDSFRRGEDVRAAFPFFEYGGPRNRVQIRCWKRQDGPFDLASEGGHEVLFPERRVCPLRFLLRHYSVRGQAHGSRKIVGERRDRVDPFEREQYQWNVHYAEYGESFNYIRDPASLRRYDPIAVRLELATRHRGVEELEERIAELTRLNAELMDGVGPRREDEVQAK